MAEFACVPDTPFRWKSALQAIKNSKESESDEANRAKADELIAQSEDPKNAEEEGSLCSRTKG
ncbi:hypothetical protein BGX34_000923 [Mortierella sp. NVP85]|nr:hypothetical protein BGX34_000923 [Mortierella sp. NVP85]